MKTKYILLLLSCCSLLACTDWLDVNPRTEKKVDEMFSSQRGFQDALTGAYLELLHKNSYGEYLTKSKIEYLVNFWTSDKGSDNEALSLHNYEHSGAEGIIERMYAQQYKVILAVNAILEHIDEKEKLFSTGGYNSIKGECLAIRAMCHFDLLRLFGPVPGEDDNTPVLSYVKTVGVNLHPLNTYNEIKEEILKDFLLAEELLIKKDAVLDEITDTYYDNNKIRINSYAVKALLARTYLWFGETQKANDYAMELISAVETGEFSCRLGTSADMGGADYVLTPEHIFSLYCFDAYQKYIDLFKGHVLFKGSNERLIKDDLFGNTGTDIREQNLWERINTDNQAQYYITKKYYAIEKPSFVDKELNYIPIIRLSEIYFIAIETGGAIEKNQELWDAFTSSRNIENSQLPLDSVELQDLLLKEYRKEFYGEGLAFYFYKRNNLSADKMLWRQAELTLNYTLPLPKTEIIQ